MNAKFVWNQIKNRLLRCEAGNGDRDRNTEEDDEGQLWGWMGGKRRVRARRAEWMWKLQGRMKQWSKEMA